MYFSDLQKINRIFLQIITTETRKAAGRHVGSSLVPGCITTRD